MVNMDIDEIMEKDLELKDTEEAVQVEDTGVHGFSAEKNYVRPVQDEVWEHVKWMQGLKLGFMMHWSPGSQLGTFESWGLCDGASEWSQGDIDWTDVEQFKKEYELSPETFKPVKFRPDLWARLAKECGFKYVLFTTKHHDGFCMFDTKVTDYKITNPKYPFAQYPYADIAGSIFEEFRKQGLGVSAYFSKPDWHDNNYWHKEFGPAKTAHVNYDIDEHPDLWEQFVQNVHTQMEEICSNYGKIDVLWLDGGWVRPDSLGQDIRLGEVVNKIRSTTQPHLIVADRTVGGEFENIITPEQEVPESPIFVPWESCITAGRYFSYHYDDRAKPGKELVHILLDVVSKGGNLALNLTPRPDGALPADQVQSIREMGKWLQVHGDGIYETQVCAPYQEDNICYTGKPGRIFAFYKYVQDQSLPESLTLGVRRKIKSITLMRTGEEVSFSRNEKGVTIDTKGISGENELPADCFVLITEK